MGGDPRQVPHPVAGRVGEAAGVDLVDDPGLPPVVGEGRRRVRVERFRIQGHAVAPSALGRLAGRGRRIPGVAGRSYEKCLTNDMTRVSNTRY